MLCRSGTWFCPCFSPGWLQRTILEFLWLYYTAGKLSISSCKRSELHENAQASGKALRHGPPPLSQKESLLTGYGNVTMVFRWWTPKLEKTLNRSFGIAITGFTYVAALLCCVMLMLCKANRPFYRYGSHIEFIRFKEYYGMPRGHSLSIYSCFLGKKRTSLYVSLEKGDHSYIQTWHNDLFFPFTIFF